MKLEGHADVRVLHQPLDLPAEIARLPVGEEPLYLCDLTDIVRKHVNWTALLPRVQPFYAVKSNDSAMVLKLLAALGTSFDCASKGEIQMVRDQGVSAERIIFANPMKSAAHLQAANGHGIRKLTFDCAIELHKIKAIYPRAQLVLRFRCDAESAECRMGDKYGCDPVTEAPGLLRLARSLDLDVIGVCFHVGSNCTDPPVYAKAIYMAKKLFRYARQQLGYRFVLLDIGGGFPGEKDTDLLVLSTIINAALQQHFDEADADNVGVQIIAEPGRYYVSSAFTLATRIHSKREVRSASGDDSIVKRMYFVNDSVYGSFSCSIYNQTTTSATNVVVPVPLRAFSSGSGGEQLHLSTVWGQTCDPVDRLCNNVWLPDLEIGELLVFENMGAYSTALASSFNGFPLPVLKYYVEPAVIRSLQLTASVEAFVDSLL